MAYPVTSSDVPTPERLVGALRPLPPVARVLARLQRLLADPNSDLDDIAELIRLDAALATRVIQISNSVWFARGQQSETITEAVNRMGFREVYHLVTVTVSGAMVTQPLAAYGRNANAMWHESVACAFAAEILAERLGEDVAGAYMSGLLHAIGRLPINQYLLSTENPRRPLIDEGFPRDHSGAEFALLGFNQADVGALMLTKWDFTPSTIQPVLHQYDPLEAQEPHDRMAAVLYGARLLRTVVCQNKPAAELDIAGEILGALHLSTDDLLGHLPELREQLSRAHQITNV